MDFPKTPNILNDIKRHMPAYLSDTEQVRLLSNIASNYPNIDYYSNQTSDDILQGDAWDALEIVYLKRLERITVSGIILSNTCDIATQNSRIYPVNIVFATLTQASAYENILKRNGVDAQRIKNHMNAVRSQTVTNRFYLPKIQTTENDYVVLLDDIHSIQREDYLSNENKRLYIRLSNAGFYAFILKLSIHFCRLLDDVNRDI